MVEVERTTLQTQTQFQFVQCCPVLYYCSCEICNPQHDWNFQQEEHVEVESVFGKKRALPTSKCSSQSFAFPVQLVKGLPLPSQQKEASSVRRTVSFDWIFEAGLAVRGGGASASTKGRQKQHKNETYETTLENSIRWMYCTCCVI